MKNKAVIGLGSNIEAEKNIGRARRLIENEFRLLKASRFVTTAPVGLKEQPDFLNGALLIETDLTHDALKERLRAMETDLGRKKSPVKHGPRSIDLDILVFNGKITDDDVHERGFVKDSVLELLPELHSKLE